MNNPTADVNKIIMETKAVLSELHSRTDGVSVQTKQILLSAMSAVDYAGNITSTNAIKSMHPQMQDQINCKYIVWGIKYN